MLARAPPALGPLVEHRSIQRVLDSLPGDRVAFRYFKDRYVLQLLAYAAAEGGNLSELRRGRFRALFQKPGVRELVGRRGRVGWDLLDAHVPDCSETPAEDYDLTFGTWGGEDDPVWYQTTRTGSNVVVQLNFPLTHDRAYRRYVEPRGAPFAFPWHPIHRGERHTLAWSRLDIDLDQGEALVEEVQSDWIREAERAGACALGSLLQGTLALPGWTDDVGCDARQLFRYVEHVLARHRRIWDQAMLAASLWLLREHLGIRRIYMHTSDGGPVLKQMGACPPPRSLYEELPRSFCFERVTGPPRFLRDALAQRAEASRCSFWYLRL